LERQRVKRMSHTSPTSSYYAIFGALMVLTAITVAVAFVDLGALNFPVALAIAITKATLVILFFMHVKYSSRLTKLVCGGAFFFLLILFGLTMTDYLSRGWHASPRGTVGAGMQLRIGPTNEAVAEPAESAPGAEPGTIPDGR
jgi:cytochrome c oxidase subunit IV